MLIARLNAAFLSNILTYKKTSLAASPFAVFSTSKYLTPDILIPIDTKIISKETPIDRLHLFTEQTTWEIKNVVKILINENDLTANSGVY